MNEIDDNTRKIKLINQSLKKARDEIAKIIVGQETMISRLFIGLLADGHILLEGVPGLAKTLTVTTFAKVIDADSKRIQFTPDLLPADLIGTSIYNPKEGTFSFKKGPIFSQILLADEINRAPAKVQSALLEVMQERQVTSGGQTYPVGVPFMVLATQNPIEQEGTYPLPEAQTDRFMLKVKIDYPSQAEEKEIMRRMTTEDRRVALASILTPEKIVEMRELVEKVHIDAKIIDYILTLVFATREPARYGVAIEELLVLGASPRATIYLTQASKAHAFLEGRAYVTPHDVQEVSYDVLRHRLRRSYEAEAENITPDEIISRIIETLHTP